MLIPLTRETFDQVIPLIATGAQYAFVWGKARDFLRRLLISLLIVVSIWLLVLAFGHHGGGIELICYIIGGLYWFWSPVYVASVKNRTYRRFPYAGFWRGQVIDVFITEELVNKEQRANPLGELVVIENLQRRINVEVGDEEGFQVTIQAPIKRLYKPIDPGQTAELLVLSKEPDLERIDKVSDLYLPDLDLWVGSYPYLRRDMFRDISAEFGPPRPRRRPSLRSQR